MLAVRIGGTSASEILTSMFRYIQTIHNGLAREQPRLVNWLRETTHYRESELVPGPPAYADALIDGEPFHPETFRLSNNITQDELLRGIPTSPLVPGQGYRRE